MKKIILSLGIIIASIVITNAQDKETRSLSDFSKLSVAQSIKVTLIKGDKNEAIVEVDGVELEDVRTDVSGSTLEIRMEKGSYRSKSITITLTYKTLNDVHVSSSGAVKGNDTISCEKFNVHASSSGRVQLVLNVRSLDVHASSSGKIELAGKAKYQDIHASSSGRISAFDLDSEEADIHVSSSGKVDITVHQKIDARASSSGRVNYRGNPEKVFVDSSSSGRVTKD